jgi:hypothetical protein
MRRCATQNLTLDKSQAGRDPGIPLSAKDAIQLGHPALLDRTKFTRLRSEYGYRIRRVLRSFSDHSQIDIKGSGRGARSTQTGVCGITNLPCFKSLTNSNFQLYSCGLLQ